MALIYNVTVQKSFSQANLTQAGSRTGYGIWEQEWRQGRISVTYTIWVPEFMSASFYTAGLYNKNICRYIGATRGTVLIKFLYFCYLLHLLDVMENYFFGMVFASTCSLYVLACSVRKAF